MNREQIEDELDEIMNKTRKLIEDAYICGYRDGYIECITHKYKDAHRDESNSRRIQVSLPET